MKLGGGGERGLENLKKNNGGSIIRYTRVEIFQNTLACFIKHYLITSHNFTVRKQFSSHSFSQMFIPKNLRRYEICCMI